ncbi:MAG: hypothetical protein QOH05_837, partial [Acetobacteraceae bacterium]|nr:hypothetical protein [Acetobacteraceae bacterium]
MSVLVAASPAKRLADAPVAPRAVTGARVLSVAIYLHD